MKLKQTPEKNIEKYSKKYSRELKNKNKKIWEIENVRMKDDQRKDTKD